MHQRHNPGEIYSHTGWREIGGEWLYLHAGGATGGGEGAEARVALSGTLRERELPMVPSEGEESREAVRASLALLKVAEDALSYTVLAATYRAPLGESDFSAHLSGPTGEGKSEFAALFQQHYGVKLDARRLLSWESTENAIEGQAFALKDQLLILDDFAPTGTSYDIERWHKKADRVLRAKGNHSGRQRMRPDTTLRPEKPPRALIISTGEDVPRGQSLRARMMVLELSPGALDWERLTGCQNAAASGLYARAMSDYIRWLAARCEDLRESLKEEHAELRKAAGASGQHRRTPVQGASLRRHRQRPGSCGEPRRWRSGGPGGVGLASGDRRDRELRARRAASAGRADRLARRREPLPGAERGARIRAEAGQRLRRFPGRHGPDLEETPARAWPASLHGRSPPGPHCPQDAGRQAAGSATHLC